MFAPLILAALLLGQTAPDKDFDLVAQQAAAALQSNPSEAAKLYGQALQMRPTWAEGWFYQAASLYQIGRYQDSRNSFLKAAKFAPDNGAVWAFLGLCEDKLGNTAAALTDIRKGEDLGLSDRKEFIATVRQCAAKIYLRSRNFGAAMEQLTPLATIGDESPRTIEAFGVTALAMPNLPGQVPAAKQGLVKLAGQAAWALSAQRVDEAKTLFGKLVARYPNEPGVHYLNGIYLLSNDPEAALSEFRRELHINPSHVQSRLQIALLDIKAGSPEKAIGLAQEAIKLQPANYFAHLVLGRALAQTGATTKAISELEGAVKLAPENAQTHFFLEQAYRRAGRTADAQKEKAEFARLKSAQDPLFRPDFTAGSNAVTAPVQ